MGATHFLMKTLPRVASEMALHVLAYNLASFLARQNLFAVEVAAVPCVKTPCFFDSRGMIPARFAGESDETLC